MRLILAFTLAQFVGGHPALADLQSCDAKNASAMTEPLLVVGEKSHQARFFSSEKGAEMGTNQKSTYVIAGDLVTHSFYRSKIPRSLCVSFRRNDRKPVVGWMKSDDLQKLDSDPTKNSDAISKTLASMNGLAWPPKVANERTRTTGWDQSSDFNFTYFFRGTKAGLEYDFDPGIENHSKKFAKANLENGAINEKGQCGVTIYNLNNAVLVISHTNDDGSCYGNHNQMDPSGVYYKDGLTF